MDILLNDKSINGQFTEENFLVYIQSDVIPCLNLFEKNNCLVYKEYDTYNLKITPDMKFADFFYIQGDPIINKLKTFLVQLTHDEPFWNNDIRTKTDISYSSIIEEIPNCITEAFERSGMLFSFYHYGFNDKYIELLRNGTCEKVRNSNTYNNLKDHFNELGIIDLWDKNSFIIKKIGYKFIIHFNEENHNIPHFHVETVNYMASLSIPDVDILAGSLPTDDKRKIESWALMNMDKIIELWNKIHPHKLI